MAELGMNINTFNKAIDDLYKAGMLIRLSRACYMVDPELYGSGSWQDVKKFVYPLNTMQTERNQLQQN